jgi:lysophospholipase L1-like esterase
MVVAFGDSITDGAYISNFATDSKDQSSPSRLAARLRREPADSYARAVINMGISANTVTTPLAAWTGPTAMQRFDREAIDRTGATHILLFEGTNDLGAGTPVDQITAALRQLIDRVHVRAIKVIGATIPPRADTAPPLGGWSTDKEPSRQALNAWIRTYPGYDGVVDFDRALADPQQPDHLRPEYDSGDHLHPGPAGRQAMADAIDLGLLTCTPDPTITLPRHGIHIDRHNVSIRGSASPGRCRSHKLDRVTVSVARLDAAGRCRYLTTSGRLLPPRTCSRPVALPARGTTTWQRHVHTDTSLPPGRYLVRAQVNAGAGDARVARTIRRTATASP